MRILRRVAYTIAALLILLFAFVQIQQHLLRHRAERLHAEILALQLHPGTFADIQRLQKEWGRHAHYEGECTPHHCIYHISLLDTASEIQSRSAWLQYHWMVSHLLLQPYSWLGAKLEKVSAEVHVRQNVMWEADFSLAVTEETHRLNPFNQPSSLVSVQINYGPRLFSFYPSYSASRLRRGYTIGVIRGAFAFINVSPRLSPNTIQQLNAINFNCMTRYRSCSTLSEFIPKQWTEYSTELATQNAHSQADYEADFHDCTPPLSLLALEARNIAIVEYRGTGIRKEDVTDLPGNYNLLRPLTYLKNGFTEQEAKVTELAIPSYSSVHDLFGEQIGKRFIIFYSRLGNNPTRPRVEQCAIFPDTPDNEREVLKGIAMDPSTGESYSSTG